MKQLRIHGLPLAIILIVGLFGSKAFFNSGFYTSHDGEHQLARLFIFEQGLRDGQIPVRYSRQLYGGIGYPLFVFTYRLPFYIGEAIRLVGLSFADSIKAVFVVTYLVSGFAMYWFASRWGRLAGFVAALLYLFTPYRFVVMYVRAALGEHVAFLFAPLLFKSIDGKRMTVKHVLLGGFSLAGLFLSHAMIVQILAIPVAIWGVGQIFLTEQRKRFLMHMFWIAAFGFSLSAYYVIPAAYYRQFTYKLNPTFFADHFVTFRQLLYSPWGFTFSMPGVDQDGMSFQVGFAMWGVVAVALGMWLLRRTRLGKNAWEVLGILGIFVFSLFLMTERSSFVWNAWKQVINIDMPWRFLLVTTFAGSALSALVIFSVDSMYAKIGIATIFLGLALYGNRNHLRVNQYVGYPDEQLTLYSGTTNSDNEYRPVWDTLELSKKAGPEALISQGHGELRVALSSSRLLRVAVRSSEPSRVDLRILYFPGWTVALDGQSYPFKYDGEGGILRVDVPLGTHIVEALWRETGLMRIGDGLTLVALGASGMIGLTQWRQKPQRSLS